MWFKLATLIHIPTSRQQKTIPVAVENCHIFEQHQLSHAIFQVTVEQKLFVFFFFLLIERHGPTIFKGSAEI